MPNHITNLLKVKGEEKRVKELFSFVESNSSKFDFNNIIPMPPRLHITSGTSVDNAILILTNDESKLMEMMEYNWVKEEKIKTIAELKERIEKNLSPKDFEEAKIAIDNIEKYGHKDWYGWSIANWGTKWNAYDIESDQIVKNEISFDTAWSSPFPVMQRLSEIFDDLRIEVYFADEDIGSNCGCYVLEKGILVNEYIPSGWEAFKFATELKNITDDEYLMGTMSWYVLSRDGMDEELNSDLKEYLSCEFERENLVRTLFNNCKSKNDVIITREKLNYVALTFEIYEAMELINNVSNETEKLFEDE